MLLKNLAFSLMESVVAAVIFTIAVAGVYASLSAVKKPTTDTDKAFIAARCGQQVLESLRAKVDSRDYDTGDLSITGSPHTVTLANYSACNNMGITSVTYDVTDALRGARKVIAHVNY